MATNKGKKTNVPPQAGGPEERTLRVVLLHPVRLSGADYAVGDELELPEADANELVDAGYGGWPAAEQGAQ